MNSAGDFPGSVKLGNPGEFTILELARVDRPENHPETRMDRASTPILAGSPNVPLDDGLPRVIDYFGKRAA